MVPSSKKAQIQWGKIRKGISICYIYRRLKMMRFGALYETLSTEVRTKIPSVIWLHLEPIQQCKDWPGAVVC